MTWKTEEGGTHHNKKYSMSDNNEIDMLILKPDTEELVPLRANFNSIRGAFKGKLCSCEDPDAVPDHDPDECPGIFKYNSYDICEHEDESTNQQFALTMYWDQANEGPLNACAVRLAEGTEIHGDVYIVKTAFSVRDCPSITDVSDYDYGKVVDEIHKTYYQSYQILKLISPDMLTDAVEVINKVLRSLPGIVLFATDDEVKQTALITTAKQGKSSLGNYFDIESTIFSQLTTIVEAVADDTQVIYCHRQSDKVVCWHILSRSCYDWIFVDIGKSESRSCTGKRCTGKEEHSDKVYAVIYGVTAVMFPESFKYTHCGNYTELLESIADVTIPEAVAHWKANGGEGKVYSSLELEGRRVKIDKEGTWYVADSGAKLRDPLTGEWHDEEEGGKVKRETIGRSERLKSAPY